MIERATEGHSVWDGIAPNSERGGFLPSEFRRPYLMAVGFLRRLCRARRRDRVPYRVVSSHRTAAENAAAGGAPKSAHTEEPCAAVDLRVLNNEERYRVVANLIAYRAFDFIEEMIASGRLTPEQERHARDVLDRPGFQRLGVYLPTASQRQSYGPASGSVHVDDSPHNPRPSFWVR